MFTKNTSKDEYFKDVKGNFEIEGGILYAGKISLQIINIVSVEIYKNNNYKYASELAARYSIIIGLIIGVVTNNAGTGVLATIITFIVLLGFTRKSWYELRFLTSAAPTFRLKAKQEHFLHRVKEAVEQAMRSPNSTVYQFNIAHQTIEKLNTNIFTTSDSLDANTIDDNATNVKTSNLREYHKGLGKHHNSHQAC